MINFWASAQYVCIVVYIEDTLKQSKISFSLTYFPLSNNRIDLIEVVRLFQNHLAISRGIRTSHRGDSINHGKFKCFIKKCLAMIRRKLKRHGRPFQFDYGLLRCCNPMSSCCFEGPELGIVGTDFESALDVLGEDGEASVPPLIGFNSRTRMSLTPWP